MTKAAGFLLTHGAGGDRDHRLFLAIEDQLDLPVRRMNFPYREKGPKRPPDRAPKLIAAINAEVESWCGHLGTGPETLVLGGRSMGGRMCSMAVAEGLPAAGLVLLSYPLHPPGKPDKLRVDHFGEIDVPCLFVSGDRDPFGKPPEFEKHLGEIHGSVDVVWLEGDAHDPKKNDDLLVASVTKWIEAL